MNIYYNIKSPIESDKNVRKIVDAYLKSKENGESLYGSAVSYGEQDSKFNEKEFSIFRRKIENLELKRIRRLDEKDVKKYNLAKKIPMVRAIVEKIVGRGATREFPNYEQYKLVMNHSNEEIFMRYDAIKNGKKKSLSREDKAIVSLLDDYLINEVHTFNGIAAYHVYEDELEGCRAWGWT